MTGLCFRSLSSLNNLDEHKNRLIDITVDGKVDDSELQDFARIKAGLDRLSITIEGLKLWCEKTVADGHIDKDVFEEMCNDINPTNL